MPYQSSIGAKFEVKVYAVGDCDSGISNFGEEEVSRLAKIIKNSLKDSEIFVKVEPKSIVYENTDGYKLEVFV